MCIIVIRACAVMFEMNLVDSNRVETTLGLTRNVLCSTIIGLAPSQSICPSSYPSMPSDDEVSALLLCKSLSSSLILVACLAVNALD